MVLLLYTSHNSPSHQARAIFYLGDDISIRLCQPLTAAPWVVVLRESIVNQDNINEISPAEGQGAGGNPRLGQGISSDDCSARTHTERVCGRAQCLSISCSQLFSPLSFLHWDRRIHRSDKAGQQRCRNKDRNWPKGGIPVSPSSPVSAFHQRHERPVRVKIPIPKPRSGAVSRTAAWWLPSLDVTVFIYFPLHSSAMFLHWLKV